MRGANVAYVGAEEAARLIGTDIYLGAFVDRRAGAIQPLSYARELARVAMEGGARIHGGTRVLTLSPDDSGWKATTSTGSEIRAETVLLCANAYSDTLFPELPRSIVAANSLQIATESLSP